MVGRRIAYITAGAAGMYCGSCLHDNTLAAALQRLGHDVALIPVYTPIRTDEDDVSIDRVFYGAVNVYLEQKMPAFRHAPDFVHRLLDRPALLNWVSGRAVSVDAQDLGALTVSVLEGEEGNQRRELDELVGWLRDSFRPELVHITNSMLLGLAGPIKRELGVPVLCSVQGEDLFLEELDEPHRERAEELLRRHARDVDMIIATSRYYADAMGELLRLPPHRLRVVRLGINVEGHGGTAARAAGGPFVIGYLARIAPEKGLHLLAEAFRILADEVGNERVELRAAGWLGRKDEEYLEGVRRDLDAADLGDRFSYAGEVTRRQKIEFLGGLDVLSVPTTYREPKGLFVLEALANGVPVVQPRHGAFPEIIEATGGGLLTEPNSAEDLARNLELLMRDQARRQRLGSDGKRAVHGGFTDAVMAEATLRVYASLM